VAVSNDYPYGRLTPDEWRQFPARTRERLVGEAHAKIFTTDLSVNEFLVTREVHCRPIVQVLGSSIYHIGKIADYKGQAGDGYSQSISQAHREARQNALTRLTLEAKAVNADAVIGVRLGERLITRGAHGKGGDDGDEVIEFTALGTAVSAPWLVRRQGEPIVTDLNGQDFWALARDGWEPVGFIFEYCRWHVWHVMDYGDQANQSGGQELPKAQQAIASAREFVAAAIERQARALGADFVVGSDITLRVEEVPCGWEGCNLNDLDIDFIWYGTGVRKVDAPDEDRAHEHQIPALVLGMMPLGKKKSGELLEDDEDESAELAKEAKEAEEKAYEEDMKGKGGE
jgi:uncharacterized protein YbjQ (UPF0145 family)